MSLSLREVLEEAINDEYKARATYQSVIRCFGDIRPFVNIVEAESRHIQALLPLFEKYGIAVPEDNWASEVSPFNSVQEACQQAVEDEIANAEMYERLLEATTDYPDVQHVLKQLQRASRDNHLPAFQRCMDRGNTSPGGHGKRRRRRQGHRAC